MTMMKYFINSDGDLDMDALWAYEGVVLPGNQIIVGRWWSPEHHLNLANIYSGPFILWNTDCGEAFKAFNGDMSDERLLELLTSPEGIVF